MSCHAAAAIGHKCERIGVLLGVSATMFGCATSSPTVRTDPRLDIPKNLVVGATAKSEQFRLHGRVLPKREYVVEAGASTPLPLSISLLTPRPGLTLAIGARWQLRSSISPNVGLASIEVCQHVGESIPIAVERDERDNGDHTFDLAVREVLRRHPGRATVTGSGSTSTIQFPLDPCTSELKPAWSDTVEIAPVGGGWLLAESAERFADQWEIDVRGSLIAQHGLPSAAFAALVLTESNRKLSVHIPSGQSVAPEIRLRMRRVEALPLDREWTRPVVRSFATGTAALIAYHIEGVMWNRGSLRLALAGASGDATLLDDDGTPLRTYQLRSGEWVTIQGAVAHGPVVLALRLMVDSSANRSIITGRWGTPTDIARGRTPTSTRPASASSAPTSNVVTPSSVTVDTGIKQIFARVRTTTAQLVEVTIARPNGSLIVFSSPSTQIMLLQPNGRQAQVVRSPMPDGRISSTFTVRALGRYQLSIAARSAVPTDIRLRLRWIAPPP